MGQIIEARFTEILPGENGFVPGLIKNVIDFSKRETKILPPPVRKTTYKKQEKFIHLDGRHRLLFRKMQGLDTTELYLADSPGDLMTESQFPYASSYYLGETNSHLSRRWHHVETEHLWINQFGGIVDFNDLFVALTKRFPYMRTIESFENYIKRNPEELTKAYGSVY